VSLQVPPQFPSRPTRHSNDADTFLAWAATGACLGTGLLTALSIGPFLLVLAVIAAAVLIRRRPLGIATIGAVPGLGLISFAIAYLNRKGPGQVCTSTATAQSCITEWSPWPWLAAGIVLISAGLALFLALRRSARPGTSR
jgi:hypothetical protein